jgi:hypothetical protein
MNSAYLGALAASIGVPIVLALLARLFPASTADSTGETLEDLRPRYQKWETRLGVLYLILCAPIALALWAALRRLSSWHATLLPPAAITLTAMPIYWSFARDVSVDGLHGTCLDLACEGPAEGEIPGVRAVPNAPVASIAFFVSTSWWVRAPLIRRPRRGSLVLAAASPERLSYARHSLPDPAIARPFEHGARRRTRVPSLRVGGFGRP